MNFENIKWINNGKVLLYSKIGRVRSRPS